MIAATLAMALSLAVVNLLAGHLGWLHVIPRSRWLSLAGGASVAYVFVHVLPELQAGQQVFDEREVTLTGFMEHHVYLMALVGFAAFYGLERLALLARTPRGDEAVAHAPAAEHEHEHLPRPEPVAMFWLHIGAFTLYNALIGYLLLHREERSLESLTFFTLAMGLHMLVNDHGLRDHHRMRYDLVGRWLLAAAVFVGWGAGLVVRVSDAMVAVLFGLLAGAVILNVIKEELPSERQSAFWAFALGAAAYAALLVLTE